MSKLDKVYMLRQQMAAAAGRDARVKKAQAAIMTETGIAPSIRVDRDRITLPGLRFMGEEPHPSQAIEGGDDGE